jgi:hypothetical protein
MRKEIVIALCLAMTVAGCSEPEPPKPAVVVTAKAAENYIPPDSSLPEMSVIAQSYKSLQSMTLTPVAISHQLSALCIDTSAYEKKIFSETVAAHSAHISIFMNDAAAKAFEVSKPYPIGSTIVKQKETSGIGGMVKRPPGYDPDHGDWEYFYFEDPKEIAAGTISTCVNCHAGAKATDHVFGSWASCSNP